MKKMLVTLSIVGFLFGSNAYAGSCEVPKFLKAGKTYSFSLQMTRGISAKVLEIDDDSCWIKLAWSKRSLGDTKHGTEWFNLVAIAAIEEK